LKIIRQYAYAASVPSYVSWDLGDMASRNGV